MSPRIGLDHGTPSWPWLSQAVTPTGQLLYRPAKALVAEAARLERATAELARGQEPQIRHAVDVIYPTWLPRDCFKAFADDSPTRASSSSRQSSVRARCTRTHNERARAGGTPDA